MIKQNFISTFLRLVWNNQCTCACIVSNTIPAGKLFSCHFILPSACKNIWVLTSKTLYSVIITRHQQQNVGKQDGINVQWILTEFCKYSRPIRSYDCMNISINHL